MSVFSAVVSAPRIYDTILGDGRQVVVRGITTCYKLTHGLYRYFFFLFFFFSSRKLVKINRNYRFQTIGYSYAGRFKKLDGPESGCGPPGVHILP